MHALACECYHVSVVTTYIIIKLGRERGGTVGSLVELPPLRKNILGLNLGQGPFWVACSVLPQTKNMHTKLIDNSKLSL